MGTNIQHALGRYSRYYDSLRIDTVENLRELVTADVHFRDSFNDIHGVEPMIRVTRAMFDDLGDLRFRILDTLAHDKVGFMRWELSCKPKRLHSSGLWISEGVSRLSFTDQGLVCEHLDYWDSGELYQRIPLLGCFVRALKKRLELR
jgi:predicted ester cyclase